jgi:hypothetical protein
MSRDSPTRIFFRRSFLLGLLIAIGWIVAVFALVHWQYRTPNYPIVQISSPVVSPSGQKVAIVVVRGDKRSFDWRETGDIAAFNRFSHTIDVRLAVLSLADTQAIDTRAEISNGLNPMTWAADESHVVFVSGRIDPTATHNYMGLDSIDLATLTTKYVAPAQISTPRYSPDGMYLGYIRGDDLMLENIQTGEQRLVQTAVNHYHWCWSPGSAEVCYIKRGTSVCQYDLQAGSERVLFAAAPTADKHPSHVIFAPDGQQVGYHFDGWFHTVDLQSGKITQQFQCDHYFVDFDWNATGICYLDRVVGDRRNEAKVMVFDQDGGKSSLVTVGPFSYPRWIDKSTILIRKGNTELWTLDVADGSGRRLFGE